MASKTIRRRLHHRDVDGPRHEHLEASGLAGLEEPLLGNYKYENGHIERDGIGDPWDDEGKKQHLHWMFLFSQLIAHWAQWLANVVAGSGSLIGRIFPFSSSMNGIQSANCLSPLQEERLRDLRKRLEVPFDGSQEEHQDALKRLWRSAFPGRKLPSLKSDLWKEMGWQGPDPSTDFRGGGFISLENLIFFAERYPRSFQKLLQKAEGERSEWEYPFAVAGINISYMLAQMLDLETGKVGTVAGARFLELLGRDDAAFDRLYCVAFEMLDAQWLAKHASYMEFNDVLKSTRAQLERELALEDAAGVEDLLAYNLLK